MFDFNDWGSWGIGDFYNGNEEELRKAIESGEPFDTGWHGFKKELQSMRISRNKENTLVEISCYMDSIYEEHELFYDFLTDEEAEMITDEMIDDICDDLVWTDCVDEIEDGKLLDINATFDEVIKEAEVVRDSCNKRLHESFLTCIVVTLDRLYENDPKKDEIIQQRYDKYNEQKGE